MCRNCLLIVAIVVATMARDVSLAQSSVRCNACGGTGKVYCCLGGTGRDFYFSSELGKGTHYHHPCRGTGKKDCPSCDGAGYIEVRRARE